MPSGAKLLEGCRRRKSHLKELHLFYCLCIKFHPIGAAPQLLALFQSFQINFFKDIGANTINIIKLSKTAKILEALPFFLYEYMISCVCIQLMEFVIFPRMPLLCNRKHGCYSIMVGFGTCFCALFSSAYLTAVVYFCICCRSKG